MPRNSFTRPGGRGEEGRVNGALEPDAVMSKPLSSQQKESKHSLGETLTTWEVVFKEAAKADLSGQSP